ncbi:hypothetical protein SAMN05216266_1048 [Amycolatopsis marina]|uniref:Hpr(Ser) kinase/phosphatase n=1 Tax=Amycolatopsis marina TaxID=490629 RepID=A0A1I0XUG7_9PSEU|nr:hypothetical protein [Amycolatopsis marina]SFB04564.1 hypothetical protein SAMN05216266_1048 [Amycolatopsis marina]
MPAPGDDSLPHRLTIRMLGAHVLVRCQFADCRDGIAEYFSSAVEEQPWRTPDVVVDCTWRTADRYLFRARPDDHPDPVLAGVWVHAYQQLAGTEWPSRDAPLPPMSVPPFRDRFVGLHAGTVRTPEGAGLCVVGDKGAGKTTTTVDLVNDHGCALLTDEATFVHRRTRIAEPFPRAVGVADRYDRGRPVKRHRPADQVCRAVAEQPVLLSRLVFLLPAPDIAGVRVEAVSPSDAFCLMLPHQFAVGVSAHEGLVTLLELARSVDAVVVRYSGYEALRTVAGTLVGMGAGTGLAMPAEVTAHG